MPRKKASTRARKSTTMQNPEHSATTAPILYNFEWVCSQGDINEVKRLLKIKPIRKDIDTIYAGLNVAAENNHYNVVYHLLKFSDVRNRIDPETMHENLGEQLDYFIDKKLDELFLRKEVFLKTHMDRSEKGQPRQFDIKKREIPFYLYALKYIVRLNQDAFPLDLPLLLSIPKLRARIQHGTASDDLGELLDIAEEVENRSAKTLLSALTAEKPQKGASRTATAAACSRTDVRRSQTTYSFGHSRRDERPVRSARLSDTPHVAFFHASGVKRKSGSAKTNTKDASPRPAWR